jgi:hypothetical protein
MGGFMKFDKGMLATFAEVSLLGPMITLFPLSVSILLGWSR